MKRRAAKKAKRRFHAERHMVVRRANDRHDRWYTLAFMRGLIETLARQDIGVDQKLALLAAAARRTAPSIMKLRDAHRASVQSGLGEEDK